MIAMVMMKECQPAFRTMEGWARIVLLEVGAIREREEHGWIAAILMRASAAPAQKPLSVARFLLEFCGYQPRR
jgi:hypothetical protein